MNARSYSIIDKLLGLFSLVLIVVLAVSIGGRVAKTAYAHAVGPPSVIYYEGETGWSDEIGLAVAQWNQADIGVKLAPATAKNKAKLHFSGSQKKLKESDYCTLTGCLAFTDSDKGMTLGQDRYIELGAPYVHMAKEVRGEDVRVVIHEIGHALGLPHSKGCSIMAEHPTALEECGTYSAQHIKLDTPSMVCGPFPADVIKLRMIWHGRSDSYPTGICGK